MRAVVQRVHRASVRVGGGEVGAIGRGLLVFLGVHKADTEADLTWLAQKVVAVRLFEDEAGKMNMPVTGLADAGVLLISQFTLFGNLRKGTRPSFNNAGPPDMAREMYLRFRERIAELLGKDVPTGRFAQEMVIDTVNAGPVTLIIDSHDKGF